MREAKALEIAARYKITFADGAFTVPSQSGKGTYKVVLAASSATCTCEDFQLRQQHCKHILACRLVLERESGGKAPAIDTDIIPKRPTYAQDWPAYNQAQQTEKTRFQALLFDLCCGITEPPQPKTGRRKTPLADRIVAVCLKVFTGFSSRRFACDLKAAAEAGYLSRLMNSMSVNLYLEDEALTAPLLDLIVRSSLPLKLVETKFAPDSTGFSTSRFTRWFDEKYGAVRSGRDWVKAHAICGVKTNVVTAVTILDRDAADCPQFKPLVGKTAENFKVEEVCADKAYLSNENLELLAGMGGTAFVPFKSNSTSGEQGSVWEKMYGYYTYRKEDFLRHYHLRSNAESTFSMVKAKFGDAVRSKTDTAMKNEALAKFLCHNIVVVHQSHVELGIEPVFWKNQAPDHPAILSFINRG